MKYTPYATLAAFAATTLAASAANLAQSGTFDRDIHVDAGDYWQSNGTTTTFAENRLFLIEDADQVTIIQKGAGTSMLILNSGKFLTARIHTLCLIGYDGGTGIVTINGEGKLVVGTVGIGLNGGTGILNINDEGLVYLGRLDIQNGTVNFGENSMGKFLVRGWDDSDYQQLWDDGKLTYNGKNNGNFDDHFEFIENYGDSYIRVLVPEPSTSALFGIAGLALLLRRHK